VDYLLNKIKGMLSYVEARVNEKSPIVEAWLLEFNEKGKRAEKIRRAKQLEKLIRIKLEKTYILEDKERDLTKMIECYKQVTLDMRTIPQSYMRDVAIAELVKRSLFFTQQEVEMEEGEQELENYLRVLERLKPTNCICDRDGEELIIQTSYMFVAFKLLSYLMDLPRDALFYIFQSYHSLIFNQLIEMNADDFYTILYFATYPIAEDTPYETRKDLLSANMEKITIRIFSDC
jgi:hypothetical protein